MRAMITEIFAVMAPVLACAAIGYGWARSGQRFDTDFISRLVLNVGAPCLMLSVLSSVSIDLHTFKQTALACVLVALLMAGFGAIIPRLLGQDVRAYLPSFVFPNVGNMGLPVCLLAFGQEGLALALAFFMVLSVAHFPAGVLLAGGKQAGGVTALLKMPVLYAIVLALLLLWQNWTLPAAVQNSVKLIGGMTIPLMLLTLGVSLQRLQVTQWRTASLYRFQGPSGVRRHDRIHLYGGLAQLVERLPCKQEVSGSNPLISTRAAATKEARSANGPIAQLARAHD